MTKKVAVVTGGSRGIGAEIVKHFCNEGYLTVATYNGSEERAQKIKEETGCEIKKFDVCDFDECGRALQDIENDFGPIDVLINNAGITKDGMLHKMSFEQWRDVLCTNLDSCFNTCRHVIPGMRDRGFGRIINISSINGQKGQLGQANYAASKAGVIGFTKSIALENARKGITANVICPGYIETEMTGKMNKEVLEHIIGNIPMVRMGQPSEVAEMATFLASDKAAFITGAVMSVNGGQFMGG
jgi:acetoacetyl-CoA reductase